MDNAQLVKVLTHEHGILQIILNRSTQLNALNHALLLRLSQLFDEIKHEKSIKSILITGEGKGFCAGADISELRDLNGNSGVRFAKFGQQVFRQLELIGKPSIAAIHGFALGGGCELAMAATLRIASQGTQLGQPEIKLGVIPGFGGTQRLARLIGKGRALDLCLTARRFSAEEALQWGFISEITSPENLLSRAKEILTELAKLSPNAISNIISVIHHGYDLPMLEALELEALHFGLCCASKDKLEGVSAFLEKRTAVFNGDDDD